MAAINFKSFSEVLVKRQGGINLKPGCSLTTELTEEEVKAIFGGIPNYTVRYGLLISVTPLNNGCYKVVVKRGR